MPIDTCTTGNDPLKNLQWSKEPVESVDIGRPAQESLPEDGHKYDANDWHTPVHRL